MAAIATRAFDRVKEFTAEALAVQPAPRSRSTCSSPTKPQKLKDVVVARRDPSGLPALTAQLAVRTDYLAKTEPNALGATARSIAGLEGLAIDGAHVEAALAALQAHLEAPTSPAADLAHVIAIGGSVAAAARVAPAPLSRGRSRW